MYFYIALCMGMAQYMILWEHYMMYILMGSPRSATHYLNVFVHTLLG